VWDDSGFVAAMSCCGSGNDLSGFIKAGVSLLTEKTCASEEGICSMKLVTY
jgi:hypothetical protein